MRFACIADLHGHLPVLPECDALLIGGDMGPHPATDYAVQERWFLGPFRDWIRDRPVPRAVVIAM